MLITIYGVKYDTITTTVLILLNKNFTNLRVLCLCGGQITYYYF